jgi:hypothetical protein
LLLQFPLADIKLDFAVPGISKSSSSPKGISMRRLSRYVRRPFLEALEDRLVLDGLPTTTSLTSSTNPVMPGEAVRFFAVVRSEESATPFPTGSVDFRDGSTTLETVTLNNQATAAFTTSALSLGRRAITAVYSGSDRFASSTSDIVYQVVGNFAEVALVASFNPSGNGQSVGFTATVTAGIPGNIPTGTITFADGQTTLATVEIQDSQATFTTSSLAVGSHTLTALYSGDGHFPKTTSADFIQRVGSDSERFVDQVYRDLLKRPADAGGLFSWTAALTQGHNRIEVAQAIANSDEYRARLIKQMFVTYLHRQGSDTEVHNVLVFWDEGNTITSVRAAFVSSGEYFQERAGGTINGFLDALYSDALGRGIDPGGQASFQAALAQGVSREDVATVIFSSTEYRRRLISGFYTDFLLRKADAPGLDLFTNAMNLGAREENVIAVMLASAEYSARV